MESIELFVLRKELLENAISKLRKGILIIPIHLRPRSNLSEGLLKFTISNNLRHKAKINGIILAEVNDKGVREIGTIPPFELENKEFVDQIIKFECFEGEELQKSNDIKIRVLMADFMGRHRLKKKFSISLDQD
jgi:hypothetical protein